jgi:hypothetical protein
MRMQQAPLPESFVQKTKWQKIKNSRNSKQHSARDRRGLRVPQARNPRRARKAAKQISSYLKEPQHHQ